VTRRPQTDEERAWRRERDYERRQKIWTDETWEAIAREVNAKMAEGLSFDDAWIAAGGSIIPLAPVN
jgi:hypothetical protein